MSECNHSDSSTSNARKAWREAARTVYILVPGASGNSTSWHDFLPAWHREVIAYSLPYGPPFLNPPRVRTLQAVVGADE